MSNARKFFLVYSVCETDQKYEDGRPFTKSDMHWFGTDERRALSTYRSVARYSGKSTKAHIKCVDLDSIPDYVTADASDTMIGSLCEQLVSPINHSFGWSFAKSRGCKTSKGVTFSISTDTEEDFKIRPNSRGQIDKSLIHRDDIDMYYVKKAAFKDVLPILVDHYLRNIEVLVPTKININSKTYKKLEPNK